MVDERRTLLALVLGLLVVSPAMLPAGAETRAGEGAGTEPGGVSPELRERFVEYWSARFMEDGFRDAAMPPEEFRGLSPEQQRALTEAFLEQLLATHPGFRERLHPPGAPEVWAEREAPALSRLGEAQFADAQIGRAHV